MNKRFKQIVLILGDLGVLFLSLWLSLGLRFSGASWGILWQENFPYFIPLFPAWLLILYISGAYNLNLVYSFRRFWRAALSTILFAGLLSVVYFYLKQSPVAPKTILAIFILVFTGLFALWRSLASFLIRSYLPANHLALLGDDPLTKQLFNNLPSQPHQGYRTASVFKTLDEAKTLPTLIKERHINTIVLGPEFTNNPEITKLLFSCLTLDLDIYSLSDFYESVYGRVPIDSIGQDWFIENLNQRGKNYFNVIKRAFDILGSFIILVISSPFWLLIALAIKLDSRGPVFFRQQRVGINETLFQILKFRTMRVTDNDGSMTGVKDQRITRIGNILRRTRLDEIPQMINILKGEMSFIGPRPERPEFVSELSQKIPFYKTRLLVKPGLSGWDQISGVYHSPSLEDSIAKLEHDLYYLKYRSIYLDLSITLKTIATILSRGGR